MQTRKNFFSPLTFTPKPPVPQQKVWLLGPDPQWVIFFSKTPRMFKMISATGDHCEACMLGTWDPPTGHPEPPMTPFTHPPTPHGAQKVEGRVGVRILV